jgi:hypothetical protein
MEIQHSNLNPIGELYNHFFVWKILLKMCTRVDSCESMVEITTPYWAANSAGKVRAIVNTQHFEQAIQQEVCSKTSTKHCVGDCGCEQKYKWHRLLAYDPGKKKNL